MCYEDQQDQLPEEWDEGEQDWEEANDHLLAQQELEDHCHDGDFDNMYPDGDFWTNCDPDWS